MTEIRQGDQIRKLPDLPDPPGKGAPQYEDKTTYKDEVTGLIKDVRNEVQLSSMAPMIAALRGNQQGGGGDIVNQQLVGMMTTLSGTLTNLIAGEREARQKAEEATSTWQKEYFTAQANNFKEMREKANNPPVAPTTPDKFQEFKQWNDMITEESNKQIAILKAQVPAVHSGPSNIDLERDRLNYENQRLMIQMQQAHELAMEDIKIKQAQFSLEVAKFKRGEESKTGWLDEVLGVLGMAVQQGANGGSNGGPLGVGAASKTPGGVVSQECGNCHSQMYYAPDAESVFCGTCGQQYKLQSAPPPPPPPGRGGGGREAPPPQLPDDVQFDDAEYQRGG